MSIFKETFRDYVRDQLSIRDKVISRGNSGTEKGATLPRRNQSSTVKLQSGKEITLDPGAFYSLFNRQCVIRMTSMTDYVEDVGLDIGINNEDGTRSNSTFASIKGSTLAQNFILQGGVLSDFARNIKGERVVKRVTTPRDGFPRPGQKTSLSYGDGGIVSDATSDGYGIVPMPGIIDANIRTKSAYGSLREAKVNFVCHNQRQLEVLEMLYMRPGYAVLLEWGWSPYVGNDGRLVNEFKTVENDISSEVLFSNKVTQQDIFRSIDKLKETSFGNYDGMLGFTKNFGFQARPDGGFDCFIELISVGEVLDSIKTGINNKLIFDTLSKDTQYTISGLRGLIQSLKFLNSDIDAISNKFTILEAGYSLTKLPTPLFFQGLLIDLTLGTINLFRDDDKQLRNVEEQRKYINEQQKSQNDLLESFIQKLGVTDINGLKNYILLSKDYGKTVFGADFNVASTSGFIRWDALVALINEQFVPVDENNRPVVKLLSDRAYPLSSEVLKIDPLLYTVYRGNDGLADVSGNINTCILPNQFKYNIRNIEAQLGKENVPDISVWNIQSTISNYIGGNTPLPRIVYDNPDNETDGNGNPLLSKTDRLRRIGSIFISIDFLDSLVKNKTEDDSYTIGQFVKDIWDGINKACPNHNFVLHEDKFSPAAYIIDLGVSGPDLPLKNELYELTPFSNENILREFNFESHVPTSLSATIAIQAQDPKSVEDIEGVTFSAFNRSIKNRILSINTESNITQTRNNINKTKDQYIEEKLRLWETINDYINNFFKNLKIINDEGSDEADVVQNIANVLKRYQTINEYLRLADNKRLSSTVIPLSFNATLDGISGMVIGNVFKITEDRLPRAYRKADIGFILFNEDQTITSGQDWVTKIGGQLILLPQEIISTNEVESVTPYESVTNSEVRVETNSELDESQKRVTDIGSINETDFPTDVYLKKVKIIGIDRIYDDGEEVFPTRDNISVGFAFVRNSPEINNERSFDLFNDNVIGAFNSWDRGASLISGPLGQAVEISRVNLKDDDGNENRIAILPEYLSEFDKQDWGTFKSQKFTLQLAPGDNPIASNGTTYFKCIRINIVNKPLSEGGTYEGEFTLIPTHMATKEASVWYRIEFNENADNHFLNRYVLFQGNNSEIEIDRNGADEKLDDNIKLSEYSKTNPCWMRFDVLAASAESAGNVEILTFE
jgi:hypothetical protein